MIRVFNWLRQNAVTVFDVLELLIQTGETVLMALARLFAFTASTKDDVWVAKLHDALTALRGPLKAAKAFLLAA